MRLTIVRGGGLAAITTRVELDSGELPDEDARRLADAARALSSAPPAEPGARRPDELLYRVAVDPPPLQRRFTEASLPDDVRALIAWADAHPARRESLG